MIETEIIVVIMKFVINPACGVMKEFIWLESPYFLVEI